MLQLILASMCVVSNPETGLGSQKQNFVPWIIDLNSKGTFAKALVAMQCCCDASLAFHACFHAAIDYTHMQFSATKYTGLPLLPLFIFASLHGSARRQSFEDNMHNSIPSCAALTFRDSRHDT